MNKRKTLAYLRALGFGVFAMLTACGGDDGDNDGKDDDFTVETDGDSSADDENEAVGDDDGLTGDSDDNYNDDGGGDAVLKDGCRAEFYDISGANLDSTPLTYMPVVSKGCQASGYCGFDIGDASMTPSRWITLHFDNGRLPVIGDVFQFNPNLGVGERGNEMFYMESDGIKWRSWEAMGALRIDEVVGGNLDFSVMGAAMIVDDAPSSVTNRATGTFKLDLICKIEDVPGF
ncbi:MAG: hypothetical protein Kow0090_20620 [Myxococcota bacterium]